MRSCICILLVAAASCTSAEPNRSPLTGDSVVVDRLNDAAERYDVPAAYLAAIGYVETRFSMRADDEPSMVGGHGMLHLVEGDTLDRAAALTNAGTDALRTDLEAHVDGAAAVLADLRGETGSWREAIARYGPGAYDEDAGLRYVDSIEQLVRRGFHATDEHGASIVLAASDATPGHVDENVGAVREAARPDYGGARWVGPACEYTNASRGPSDIDYVVIHTCQGGFSGCWGWLKACGGATASVHYVVSSSGEIVQIVEEQDIAYHDGCFNSRTVGIEHEGFVSDPGRWYTDAMYCASARLTRSICDRNGIPCDRAHVIGHVEAPDCSDHTDPGSGWNWSKYMEYVRCGCGGCCRPGRTESCNGVDDDCDGRVDEGLSRRCGTDVGACRRGTQTCSRGSWGACTGGISPSTEACNGIDDDCDGAVDDSVRRSCGTDVGECVAGVETCTAGTWGACEGSVDPVPERCDELDNDCDGESDDEDVCEVEELLMQGALYGTDTDLDGDGKSDACACADGHLECYLASGHGFEREVPGPAYPAEGFEHPARYSTLRMGDIDGDGRADACLRDAGGIRCWTSDGRGFGTELEGPPLSDEERFDEAPYFTSLRLADVNADGRADLCARWPDGLRCYHSTGNGFDESVLLPDLADEAGFGAVEHYGTLRTGDIDGDGRADVCARNAEGVLCWRSTAHGFSEPVVGPAWRDDEGWAALAVWSTMRLADVDGDGRDDLCARTPAGFECHPATEHGFAEPYLGPALGDDEGWSDKSQFATLRMGDVDGDERVDLCGRTAEGVVCWLFTGRGFDRRIEGPALSDEAGWTDPSWFRTIRLADVNGDGRADLCARDASGVRCWRSDGRSFPIELPGPAWAEGWDAPERFGTIRLAGGASSPTSDVPGVSDGGLQIPDDPGEGCSCSVPGGPGRTPATPWIATAILVLFGLRRLRRGPHRSSTGAHRP